MYKLTRRAAIKSLLVVAAASTSFALKSAAANEVGKYITQSDVKQPPLRRPKLFDALEIMVGKPVKYIPKSKVLKDVTRSRWMTLKASLARRFTNGRYDRFQAWRALLAEVKDLNEFEQLERINEFVNATPYKPDQKNFGVSDSWVGPDVFFEKGGDCEDYAIAKMASLRALGYHSDRLRMVIVDDNNSKQKHAFLAVYYGGKVFLLDNQIQKVITQDKVRHYEPICSLSPDNLWVHWRNGKGSPKLSAGRDFSSLN